MKDARKRDTFPSWWTPKSFDVMQPSPTAVLFIGFRIVSLHPWAFTTELSPLQGPGPLIVQFAALALPLHPHIASSFVRLPCTLIDSNVSSTIHS